jgi:hypothetical protein
MERFTGRLASKPGPATDLASVNAWRSVGPLNVASEFGAIQPTILVHTNTRLQILCRSQQGVITQAWSEDGGRAGVP